MAIITICTLLNYISLNNVGRYANSTKDISVNRLTEGMFHNLAPGAKWVYNDQGEVTTYTVSRIKPDKMTSIITIYQLEDGKQNSYRELIISNSGLYILKHKTVLFDPPLCLVKFPFKIGEVWECQSDEYGEGPQMERKLVGKDTLMIRGKKYDCWIVKTFVMNNGRRCVLDTCWYDSEVGMVKIDRGNGAYIKTINEFSP